VFRKNEGKIPFLVTPFRLIELLGSALLLREEKTEKMTRRKRTRTSHLTMIPSEKRRRCITFFFSSQRQCLEIMIHFIFASSTQEPILTTNYNDY